MHKNLQKLSVYDYEKYFHMIVDNSVKQIECELHACKDWGNERHLKIYDHLSLVSISHTGFNFLLARPENAQILY